MVNVKCRCGTTARIDACVQPAEIRGRLELTDACHSLRRRHLFDEIGGIHWQPRENNLKPFPVTFSQCAQHRPRPRASQQAEISNTERAIPKWNSFGHDGSSLTRNALPVRLFNLVFERDRRRRHANPFPVVLADELFSRRNQERASLCKESIDASCEPTAQSVRDLDWTQIANLDDDWNAEKAPDDDREDREVRAARVDHARASNARSEPRHRDEELSEAAQILSVLDPPKNRDCGIRQTTLVVLANECGDLDFETTRLQHLNALRFLGMSEQGQHHEHSCRGRFTHRVQPDSALCVTARCSH